MYGKARHVWMYSWSTVDPCALFDRIGSFIGLCLLHWNRHATFQCRVAFSEIAMDAFHPGPFIAEVSQTNCLAQGLGKKGERAIIERVWEEHPGILNLTQRHSFSDRLTTIYNMVLDLQAHHWFTVMVLHAFIFYKQPLFYWGLCTATSGQPFFLTLWLNGRLGSLKQQSALCCTAP